jgi:formate dehydrogenase iron-sulfur subunit
MYLSGTDFTHSELPKLEERGIPERTEAIQHAIFKNFVPPLALYGLLALGMYTFKERGKKEQDHERS